jgi:hypothetical protein
LSTTQRFCKGGKGEETEEDPTRNHPSASNQIIIFPKTTPKTSAVRAYLQQYTGGRLNDLAHLESFEHWPGDVVICLFEFHLREQGRQQIKLKRDKLQQKERMLTEVPPNAWVEWMCVERAT